MSCSVMTRGIGSTLLVHIVKLAEARRKRVLADFTDTGRNRVMYITYKLMGFGEKESEGSLEAGSGVSNYSVLEYMGDKDKEYPLYLKVIVS